MNKIKIKNNNNKKNYLWTLCQFIFILLLSGHAFASDITQENIERLINKERASRELPELTINQDLNNAASLKSRDMINRDYFEHFAHNLTPWIFIKNSGYDYLYAGENLAMDFKTSEGMVKAWMNSPAHRDNILNPDFDEIGIGVIKGEFTDKSGERETTMVSNMFGRKKPTIIKIFDNIANNFRALF